MSVRYSLPRIMPMLGVVLYGCVQQSPLKVSEPGPRRLPEDSIEIASLRRQIDSLQTQHNADSVRYVALKARLDTALAVVQAPPATPDSVLQSKDAEIAALHDQLTKLSQELERIKRRLANPRP